MTNFDRAFLDYVASEGVRMDGHTPAFLERTRAMLWAFNFALDNPGAVREAIDKVWVLNLKYGAGLLDNGENN